jgi:hypothetical protein
LLDFSLGETVQILDLLPFSRLGKAVASLVTKAGLHQWPVQWRLARSETESSKLTRNDLTRYDLA